MQIRPMQIRLMQINRSSHKYLLAAVLLFAPFFGHTEEVTIPAGTPIFGELQERVTSNPRRFKVGREVDGTVWRDVVVDGHTVVRAGSPMSMHITRVDSTGVGGRGGRVEIMAVAVTAVDGSEITLSGGYGDVDNDRYGLTRALGYLLWPAGFLPGRRAVLDVGTVFDAAIPANTRVSLPDDALPTLELSERGDLTIEILYDEINERQGTLPMALTLCNREFVRRAEITAVNEESIRPIMVAIISSRRGEPCHEFTGRSNLEDLRKVFSPGINRFTVTMSGAEDSVVLNVEM